MPRSSRTRDAARRASFGRAERLRREAGEDHFAKPAAPRQKQPARDQMNRKARADRDPARPTRPRDPVTRDASREPVVSRETAQPRKVTSLGVVERRVERAREASESRRLQRLKERTRHDFNREGERRRDTARRVEQDRKRDALLAKDQRIAEHQRRANIRRLERKRGEMRRDFARATGRRDAIRRAHDERVKAQAEARQKELQRRAAVEVERDQKRRTTDQQAEHRRQTDQLRSRHRSERNSYRVNENTAMERHHHAIKGIDEREARELADFDGRRSGLRRMAELVPGRRAEGDRQRDAMVRGYEAERLAKHRDFEAFKERQFASEQKARLDHAHERKALMEMHREDRASANHDHAADRPRLIEERTRVIERADRAREGREQERPAPARENVRPSEDFRGAASGRARETAPTRERTAGGEGRELSRSAPAFERMR